jgi:hypothetical protein
MRIDLPEASLWVKRLNKTDNFSRSEAVSNHTVGVDAPLDWIEERRGRDALAAVGGLDVLVVRVEASAMIGVLAEIFSETRISHCLTRPGRRDCSVLGGST